MAVSGKTDLTELFSAHRGIISEKITERKKCATVLRELLESAPIIDYITASTRGGGSQTTKSKHRASGQSSLTWPSLFRNVVGYVLKEADAVAKMEEKSRSSSTITTRKKDMSDMLRAYIRAANKRGHHMNVGEVVEHILTVLRNPRMSVWLCGDYSQILLHHILQKPHHVLQISASSWNELISLYSSLFLSSSASCDRTLLSRVLLSLFSLSSSQSDIDRATLFAFFSKAMPKIGKEKKPKILENLLLSFSAYCTTAAHDSRGRLCNLGEDILPTVLHLWGHCQPSVETQLVSLLRFQVKVHHPRGAHRDSCGGWAVSDVKWKKNLEDLYDLILADIESTSHKLQWTGKGESGLKPALIDLAADVINQVMYIRKERADCSNREFPSTDDDITHRDKRRRTQTCWSRLKDGLTGNLDNPSLMIWLQLISWLVAKWPGSLSSAEGSLLLSQLTKILREAKKLDCLPWLFTCLHVLALHPSTHLPLLPSPSLPHPSLATSVRESWGKVWTATLKSVSIRNAEEEASSLLTALVEQGLVEVDREPWKLINRAVNHPRRPLVSLLASLVSNHHLPESLGPISPSASLTTLTPSHPHTSSLWAYPLRVQLLHFLVPSEVGAGEGGGGGGRVGGIGERPLPPPYYTHVISASGFESLRPSVSLCAHLLVSLTQRSCSALQQPHLKSHYLTTSIQDKIRELLSFPEMVIDHQWRDIEQLYLESTFHTPIQVQGAAVLLGGGVEPVVCCKESPIPALMSLLLELLGSRSEKLLQSVPPEVTSSVRDRIQHLVVTMETQAYHCALVVHVLFLVGVVGGRSLRESMRKSLAINLLPSLLGKISAGLTDQLWNEVERSEYNQTIVSILQTLTPILTFHQHGNAEESAEWEASVELTREVLLASLPHSLLSSCLKLALKKSPLPPQPPSRPSSAFSTTGPSHSHHHLSTTSSSPLSPSPTPSLPPSSTFDDDMDISSTNDSDPAILSDTGQTGLTDPLSLGDQATVRTETAAFIIRWYHLTTVVPHPGGVRDQQVTNSDESFDSRKAIQSILERSEISKPVDIQIVFDICRHLASCEKITEFLDCIVELVGQVLTHHHKSQSVLCESLKLLELLSPHYERGVEREGERGKGGEEEGGGREGERGREGPENCFVTVSHLGTILSAIWSRYIENALCWSVRLQLASTLCAYLKLAAQTPDSLSLHTRKRKSSDTAPDGTSVRDALLCMINDPNHAVRMHMAKIVTSLHCVAGSNELLPREEQLEVFQEVEKMLKKAHLISMDQDGLSQEDESVNRVASMIATLQYQACCSPSCERAAVAYLVLGVGDGIDEQLAAQALQQISRCLGYPTTTRFMEGHLLSSLSSWLDNEQSLDTFPHQLLSNTSQSTFFQDRVDVIVPLLVYRSDEAALTSLLPSSSSSSLPALLSRSLPTAMALVLPSFAQQNSRDSEAGSEERRAKARSSNNLLSKHLSEEEIAESMKARIAEFVIFLLLRVFEPHTATSHLARYSRSSDPEPTPPHFSSLATRATLDYIAGCYGGSTATSSFMKQLTRKQDNIQRILLALAVAMETTHRPFRRRQLLQTYALFVNLVSDQLGQGLDGVASFVVMDVIHTVIRLLMHEAEKMAGKGIGVNGEKTPIREKEVLEEMTVALCFHILTTLARATLEACPEELGRHLQVVVTTLVTFAQGSNIKANLKKQALQLLSLLILTPSTSPSYSLHLSQLDPLPVTNDGIFWKFHEHQQLLREANDQNTLEQEINRFIRAGQSLSITTRGPGLRRLTDMIHGCRSDVSELLQCGNDSVLRLVQGLVGVASSHVTTPTVAMEMGGCLGELGGLDLNCIALPTISTNGSFDLSTLPNSWTPLACCTAHVLFLLTSLLRDRDISVVQASSQCLTRVLATKSTATVLSKMEDLYEWTSFLQPFKSSKKGLPVAAGQHIQAPPTNTTSFDTPSLWIPQCCYGNDSRDAVSTATHEAWITSLVTSLLECGGVTDQVLLLVKPVCQVKVSFCEALFPYLVLSLLWNQEEVYRPIISRHFQSFFSSAANSPSSPSPSSSFSSPQSSLRLSLTPPPPSVSTTIMLNTVMFLRTIDRPNLRKSTLWDNNFWLDLDFLDVAMAAQRCSAYFTSLLYVEIWHGAKCDSLESGDSDGSVPMETNLTETGRTGLEDPSVHQVLLEAYSNIGEPDSLYGVCTSKTVTKETWMRLYEQEGEWEKSLSAYNLSMHLPNSSCQANLVGSLHNLGLSHVLNMYLTGVGVASPHSMSGLSRFQYEAAWRCSLWEDQHISMLAQQPGGYVGYHRHLCDSLMALRDGENSLLSYSLSSARAEVLGTLCGGSQEGCGRIYHCLSQLLCLCELEEAGGSSPLQFLNSWKERLKYLDADFVYIEPVLSLRASVLHSLLQRESTAEPRGSRGVNGEGEGKTEHLFMALCDTLLTLAKKTQDIGRYQVAEGALFSLHHLNNSRSCHSVPVSLYPSLPWQHRLQEAKLHWGRGETNLALSQLRTLLQTIKALPDPPREVSSLYPLALCLYGSWLAQTHSENPAAIMKQYLELSVSLMEKQETSDLGPLLNAYLMLARYADSQYQRVTRHMTSTAYETKKQLLQKSQLELEKLTETISTEARTKNRHIRTLMAQIEEDEIVMSGLIEDKRQFLEKALHNYIHCLRTGDEHDLRVFRLCALWFANASDAKINSIITKGSAALESRKFLPLLYQLAARMSARSLATDPFQQTLQEIIFRASVDHPHHSLYVTLALSHASMDDSFPSSGHVTGAVKSPRVPSGRLAKKNSTTAGRTVDEDKVKAAKGLIRRLHSEQPSLVHSMEQLCEAYIDLAYHDVSAHRRERKPIKFPASCTLVKLAGKLSEVAVPTVDIEVDPSCSYSHLVTIDRFDTHFQLAGGVNLPKVLSCIGSDGKRRRQLVKGKDDLRQDAVMQQVFVLVNKLLQKERSTSKRKLNIRTYKVVPLSQRSGIVEWCEGTTPLGQYLVGPQGKPFQGAHCRYRPQDWASLECRRKLMDAGSKRGPSKLDTYTTITRYFRPVFHHFFMEHFPNPSEWFERRLMYTRSVATSSIVGYVVGLGDRHVQNILIDTNTAQFIHIDLGVAFEQGKTLPTPETVPFRLTRDVVDGMGVAGVEGVFRRCCEKTMEVMRASHEELRTIVEVLLYDPLYMWTISPVKALNLQRRDESTSTAATGDQIFDGGGGPHVTGTVVNGSNPSNKMAERVLLRLQEKLEGIEDGVPLSVSGQVNQLIQEATDPNNLCRLFPGWQAWI